MSARRHDAMDIAQTRRREPAITWIGDQGCAIAVRESEDLGAAMNAGASILVRSTQVRNDNTSGLSVLHRDSPVIDHFH